MISDPQVFIGGSSEGLGIAEAVRHILVEDGLPATLWNDRVFPPGYLIMEALERLTQDFTYAVLVATPDDRLIKRDVEYAAMRDNVLFEFGLFMGRLGRHATLLLTSRSVAPGLPSDFGGLLTVRFDEALIKSNKQKKRAGLKSACKEIKDAILADHEAKLEEEASAIRSGSAETRIKFARRVYDGAKVILDAIAALPLQPSEPEDSHKSPYEFEDKRYGDLRVFERIIPGAYESPLFRALLCRVAESVAIGARRVGPLIDAAERHIRHDAEVAGVAPEFANFIQGIYHILRKTDDPRDFIKSLTRWIERDRSYHWARRFEWLEEAHRMWPHSGAPGDAFFDLAIRLEDTSRWTYGDHPSEPPWRISDDMARDRLGPGDRFFEHHRGVNMLGLGWGIGNAQALVMMHYLHSMLRDYWSEVFAASIQDLKELRAKLGDIIISAYDDPA